MNNIVNMFLLAGDKSVPEMNLRQPGFTYSTSRPFTKNKERNRNLKKQEIHNIYMYISKQLVRNVRNFLKFENFCQKVLMSLKCQEFVTMVKWRYSKFFLYNVKNLN